MYVTNVFDSTCKIEEPFQYCLDKCINTVIQWKYKNVVFGEEDAANKVQEYNIVHINDFNTFEWKEEARPSNTYEGCLN